MLHHVSICRNLSNIGQKFSIEQRIKIVKLNFSSTSARQVVALGKSYTVSMANNEESTPIKLFWDWFVANEEKIKEILDDDIHPQRDALVREMDNHILGFGLFTWEMGPIEHSRSFYLTISPNSDKDLLEISKSIIALAPDFRDWTFNYAKPVKEGDLLLNLYDEDFNEHRVDALEWHFVLVPQGNKKTDIIIEAPNMSQLDNETRLEAGSLVVSSLLGEEQRIRLVRKIDIVDIFDPAHKNSATPMAQLKQRFEALVEIR